MHLVPFVRRAAVVVATTLIGGLVLFALLPGVASAHAAYLSSDPAANSVMKTAPTTVTITFAQALDPTGLSVVVYDKNAKVVSQGDAKISASNPRVASVAMTASDSDVYRVDWHTVSAADSEPTLGAFVFGVDPSGKSDKVASDATPSVTHQPANSGTNPLGILLAALAGALISAGATYYVMRSR